MTTRKLLRKLPLARQLWLIALVAAIAVGAAAVYGLQQAPRYKFSMKILVGQSQSFFSPDMSGAAATEPFTQTMSDLVKSDVVATRVVENLGLEVTPAHLLDHLDVTTKPMTAVLEVSYDDTDLVRGEKILQQVGIVFIDVVQGRAPKDAKTGSPTLTAIIFDPAHFVPTAWPPPLVSMGVAAVLGLVLGILAALARERLDDRIHGVEQAESFFGRAATAVLPPGFVGYQPLNADVTKKTSRAYQVAQRLSANILWSPEFRRLNSRSIVVVSAGPQEGKTTVAANLAIALARGGSDVIAVDADMRRPMLHPYFDVEPEWSGRLDAIAHGRVRASEALLQVLPRPLWDQRPNALSANGWPACRGRLRAILARPGRGSGVGLQPGEAVDLVKELSDDADYVIFDAPSLESVTDAYPLIAAVDTVVAIVRVGKSTRTATAALSRALRLIPARNVELIVTDGDPTLGYSDTPVVAASDPYATGAAGSHQGEPHGSQSPTGATRLPLPDQQR